MSRRKLFSLLSIGFITLFGVGLMSRSAALTAETSARQQLIRGAFAPSSLGAANDIANGSDVDVVYAAAVNLADIPAGVYDANNQYDQWLKGAIDLDEISEGRATPAEVAALQADAARLPANPNVQIAQSGPGLNAPNLLSSFDSLDINECCGGGANVPPDPHLAAGPNHLIAAVNVAFEIYDKSGTTLAGPITFASFFAVQPVCVAAPSGAFDPTVLYDEQTDRFILGVDGNGTHFCVAVTASADPLGSWWVYAIPANLSNAFHDYPHTGVGETAIYVGANQFGGSVPGGFEGRVWAIDKNKMYSGAALGVADRPTFSTGFDGTPQPLHLHGFLQGTWPATGTHYFLTDPFDGDNVQVWQWSNALGGGVPSKVATINLQTATGVTSGFPVAATQSGGGGSITANDWRMRGFEYRNGYGWTADTISCNPGAGTVNCVRWAQINLMTSPPTLTQAGVYSSNSDHRIFPDLVANDCNDMAIGYTKTNSSIFPAVWYTGRESGDLAGSLQAEAQLKAGEITYTAFDPAPRRWGDYSSMTIDPDGLTFWYIGEYSKNTGNANGRWGNYIGSFNYPNCGGGGNTIHVGDLDALTVNLGARWGTQITALVHDNSENPVDGATVTYDFNGVVTRSCTTGASGTCFLRLRLPDSIPSITATVTNVSKAGFTYDAGSNHDPDGDSDGTVIVIIQP